jgi:hypothetical protein
MTGTPTRHGCGPAPDRQAGSRSASSPAATELERRYGTGQLRLLEGRARLPNRFVSFARGYRALPGTEPKLWLVLAAYARHCPVTVITTTSQVIDLGSSPACGCAAALAATGISC